MSNSIKRIGGEIDRSDGDNGEIRAPRKVKLILKLMNKIRLS